ncbi:MAG TPA: acyl-CoA dehydrogenase family protein [Candidatus Dormibacteraeota bacterium]|jgi:hypothetical protein|nr:acyl-CoA dehydrogenase family protein [Candidatus Dormibacteraeota bacterium]
MPVVVPAAESRSAAGLRCAPLTGRVVPRCHPFGPGPGSGVAQIGYRVVTQALDLHGGRGYLRDAGVEKWWRDVAAFFHSDRANRALLIRVAQATRAGPC